MYAQHSHAAKLCAQHKARKRERQKHPRVNMKWECVWDGFVLGVASVEPDAICVALHHLFCLRRWAVCVSLSMSCFHSRTTRACVRMPRIVCREWLGQCGVVCFFPLRHIHYILWGDFQFYSIIFFYSFLHFTAAAAAATLRAFVYVFHIYSRVASHRVRQAHSHKTVRVRRSFVIVIGIVNGAHQRLHIYSIYGDVRT